MKQDPRVKQAEQIEAWMARRIAEWDKLVQRVYMGEKTLEGQLMLMSQQLIEEMPPEDFGEYDKIWYLMELERAYVDMYGFSRKKED